MERHYGWVIVAAGALITCIAMGAMFALPVYLQPMSSDTQWSRAGTSTAVTIAFLPLGVSGFAVGALPHPLRPPPVGVTAT